MTGVVAQTQITGTVTDKTTGKPAVGDTVVLVDVQTGMGEVAKTTTDAGGHYKLTKPGNSNYLVTGNSPGRALLHRRAGGQCARRHLCV